MCHPCGGKSVCPHGRHRYRCTECKGKGICEHGRRKNACRDCAPLNFTRDESKVDQQSGAAPSVAAGSEAPLLS